MLLSARKVFSSCLLQLLQVQYILLHSLVQVQYTSCLLDNAVQVGRELQTCNRVTFSHQRVNVHVIFISELPRTQLEFDGSFTVKMFCFQFVNYYSYLFYIAFFKNGVAYHPGDYFYVFGKWRAEEVKKKSSKKLDHFTKSKF